MEVSVPDKAYFRIGEVAKILGVEPHVVRYWESEFRKIRPDRSRSGQRLYRKKDVQTLLIIRELLYVENFTISGAKRQLDKLKAPVVGTEKKSADFNHDNQFPEDRERLIQIKKVLQGIRQIV